MTQILIALLMLSSPVAEERTWSRSLDVDSDVTLNVETHKGLIQIQVGDVNKMTIEARIYMAKGAEYDKSRLSDIMDAVDIMLSDSARSVRLSAEMDDNVQREFSKGWVKSWTSPTVDFYITIPPDANLELETHKGRLEVEAGSGTVEVETHKGEGWIRGVRNNIDIETHKGSLDIGIEDLYDLQIETHKGRVEVDIYQTSGFTMRGESHKGDVRVVGRNAKMKRDEDDDELRLRFTEGDGRSSIDLETHKGDIILRFQDKGERPREDR